MRLYFIISTLVYIDHLDNVILMFTKKSSFIKSLLNSEKFVIWTLYRLKNAYKIGIFFVSYGIEISYTWYLANIYKILLIFDNRKINVYSKRNRLLKKKLMYTSMHFNFCKIWCCLIKNIIWHKKWMFMTEIFSK